MQPSTASLSSSLSLQNGHGGKPWIMLPLFFIFLTLTHQNSLLFRSFLQPFKQFLQKTLKETHPDNLFIRMLTFPAMASRRILQTDIKIPPPATNGTSTDGGYTAGEDNFDNNMMIILAVLLCALICALGLNSIVRCVFRCSRRFGFETPGQPSGAGMVSKGLKHGRLTEIPVVVYLPEMKIPASDCPICLGEFTDGEKMRILPKCKHWFHVKCIDKWLVSHSSCPICRQLLFELDEV